MKFLMLRSKRVAIRQSLGGKTCARWVALPVDGLVIMVLDLAVLARWDDGRGSTFCQPVAQGFAVSPCRRRVRRRAALIRLGDLAIMDVSWCQEQDEGPAFRIPGVELGVAAPLGAADAMAKAPLFRRRRSDEP